MSLDEIKALVAAFTALGTGGMSIVIAWLWVKQINIERAQDLKDHKEQILHLMTQHNDYLKGELERIRESRETDRENFRIVVGAVERLTSFATSISQLGAKPPAG